MGSDCSDYGLQPLADESICQQLDEDLFQSTDEINKITDSDYPIGCLVYEGEEIEFNESPTGGRSYDYQGVCVAGKKDRLC